MSLSPSDYLSLSIALAAACFSGACAETPVQAKKSTDFEIPRSWSVPAPSLGPVKPESAVRWWDQFSDSTLSELVDLALLHSPDYLSARAKVEEFRARAGLERVPLYPTLSVGETATSQQTRHAPRFDSYALGLSPSWETDLFGARKMSARAAMSNLAETEYNYVAARVVLAADVGSEYLQLRQQEAQLAITRENIASLTQTDQLTKWRAQAGTANRLDVVRSESALEQAQTDNPRLEQAIFDARTDLAVLCGLPPGELDALLAPGKPIPKCSESVVVAIPADTLRQRPDVRAAEWAVKAADQQVSAARRARWPSLNLSGTLSAESLNSGRIFSPDTLLLTGIINLSRPLLDGGQAKHTVELQEAIAVEARQAYAKSVLAALQDVEKALVATQTTEARLRGFEKAATDANESVQLSEIEYKAGQVDLLDVLDAQRRLLDIKQQQVDTQYQNANAYVVLYKAMGGGWSSELTTTHLN